MKTLIAIPCMDTVPVDFMTSLVNLRKPEGTSYAVQANSMIYDSRNNLTAKALVNGYDRVLWLDSDMMFEADLLEKLSEDADMGLDFVSALCVKRHRPTGPCIYSEIVYEMEGSAIHAEAVPYTGYPRNSLFTVNGAGFGAVMVKTELLKAVWERFGPPFDPMTQMGEDLSFCWRVNQLGREMYCDSRIKVGHIGQYVYSESDLQNGGDAS